jgi:3-hydroxyisobutyrate dehydrogenase
MELLIGRACATRGRATTIVRMTTIEPPTPVGFIGLGAMGGPMALNLAISGTPLVVWNRTPEKATPLHAAGAHVADGPAAVFERCELVISMLAGEALDQVLGRRGGGLAIPLRGRTLVNTATPPPRHSRDLEHAVRSAGGRYVEAPVSGSRGPAAAGELVAMIAGEAEAVARSRPVLTPLCREIVECGDVPNALLMKLAINLYLDTSVVCLAEAVQFASAHGLDLEGFLQVLDAGPLASRTAHGKVVKLARREFSAEASAERVSENISLIAAAAAEAGIDSPVLSTCAALYGDVVRAGHGDEDMTAVVRVLEARARRCAGAPG